MRSEILVGRKYEMHPSVEQFANRDSVVAIAPQCLAGNHRRGNVAAPFSMNDSGTF